ncbi:hydrogenase maturation nickel metallochaperone HypA [Streptomyces sp. HNM0663]|uniref:Hydrogenase maturation factor HypA n=1 Tax=Streptomyces chengmaiensis TaxID=3040919 RepID=A0ABT6HSH8_9ACTN|nr:hydrogenase maturation nickel metallochaperone HypA [Streptomyces chengmaiensis]MDH2390829.1 hydrogenase maturation nickel metallochaperone HypA [Streptomyces chengmaiensis]
MHELSIAAAVVERAQETARAHGAATVDAVRLRVGELSGVVGDALRFSFRLAAEGTALAGAELIVEEVPARAACDGCDAEFAVGSPPRLWCPRCERPAARLLAGRELELIGVQLAQPDDVRPPDREPCPAAPRSAGRGEDA